MRAPETDREEFITQVAAALEIDAGEVRPIVETLAALKRPLWGNAVNNIEHFKTLRARIEKLQKTLRTVPEHVLFMTFAPEDSETLDTMSVEADRSLGDFVTTLGELRTRCDKNIAARPGAHGHFRHREHAAAIEARLLMEKCGQQITLSAESLFNRVTALLYQAAWGGETKDMRRACEAVASAPSIRTE
jgi:hypothetical protein